MTNILFAYNNYSFCCLRFNRVIIKFYVFEYNFSYKKNIIIYKMIIINGYWQKVHNKKVGKMVYFLRILAEFHAGGQSHRRTDICAGLIVVHKCILSFASLSYCWEGYPIRSDGDRVQERRFVLSASSSACSTPPIFSKMLYFRESCIYILRYKY